MDFNHTSVLLNETIDMLNIKPDGIYADCTLGGGGHSYELLRRGGPGVRLIGIDRDRDALEAAKKRLEKKQIIIISIAAFLIAVAVIAMLAKTPMPI